MAVTYGFFDSVDGDRKYSADDISNFFETLIPDGVMAEPESAFQVCENSGLTVKILPGWGFIGRKWIHNDADVYLTLDQPDIILNRADRIVLRLNRTLRTMEIAVRRGTAGESPVLPSLQRDENTWEISLAYVMIWAGASAVTQNDIGDERNDDSVCGRILGFERVRALDTLLTDLDDGCYHCNEVSDNVELPLFIENWKQTHRNSGTVRVVGNFGANDTTTAVDGEEYSIVYQNTGDFDIAIDFTDCILIHAKSCQFGYFENCTVRGLSVKYPDLTVSDENVMLNLISGNNAVFEDCHIYGSLSGTEIFITCWHLLESRLLRCSADFSSDNALWGIMADRNSFISECKINVNGTDEETVYGVSALNSHALGSDFMASGKNAYGGQAGGNFTECTFCGIGIENGYGFYVNSVLNAENCIFKGYTQDAENFVGYGLSGGNASKVFLQGITCPESIVSGYSQTGSMVFSAGHGFYTGIFYTAPVLPATILTYTDFKPTKTLTQEEYDALENPDTDTLYVIN